ncbi:MAG: UDP-3-O-(3-hydroxymyristoyl)glucosamine N-acyltransferase [Candidatus Omnitrophica bacterium]|jgi:UDP-3-O-[3-hydroxymyristoyl] glucosamine N-acyltransferase|nr:UDP-3-O-(3-hydroxymyristoyl)glucosamine N-acyltransferase [Candidatus Omnitrophota bacterium]
MQKSLKEIAQLLEGELLGDGNIVITGICGIKEAGQGDITFLANPKYLPFVKETKAKAIITARDVTGISKPVIRVDDPSLAFSKLAAHFLDLEVKHPAGIAPTAIIGKGVVLGKNVSLGAYTVVADKAVIGDNTVIYPLSYIGYQAKIGKDTLIYSHVCIRENVSIADRVIIHSGTVVGSDGFGFVAVEGKHQKIPQLGTVVVEDDVEIGANVTIDRARFDKTLIGKGTKIDNLVQIAHNVVIGKNCLVIAQVGISGSNIIGDNVTLAGQAGLSGHLTVGDGAIVAAQAGVTKSVSAGTIVSGYPARIHEQAIKVNACVQNLPRLYQTIKELKKKIEELESRIKK